MAVEKLVHWTTRSSKAIERSQRNDRFNVKKRFLKNGSSSKLINFFELYKKRIFKTFKQLNNKIII